MDDPLDYKEYLCNMHNCEDCQNIDQEGDL